MESWLIFLLFAFYRSENKESIQAMLSEASKQKRHRSTTISIHITATTWLIEFIGNSILMAIRFLDNEGNRNGMFVLFEVWWFNTTVLIPAMYVCNTDNVKDYLKTIGWYNSIIDRFRSNKVSPMQNENIVMNAIPNNNVPARTQQNTANSSMKPKFKKLSKTHSDSQILHNVKEKCRKMSI